MLLNFIFSSTYARQLQLALNARGIIDYKIERQLVDLGPCMPCEPLNQKIYKILDTKGSTLIGWVKMGTIFWGLPGNEMTIYLEKTTISLKPLSAPVA